MQTKESAFTPQRQGSFLNLLITIVICAGIAWLVLRACSSVSLPQFSTDAKPQATAIATAEIRQYCEKGNCVKVTMCTAVGGDCASIEPGPKADYGTGFHVSADGRTRPNPPVGWKWAGK
jgi:hypothetical protein